MIENTLFSVLITQAWQVAAVATVVWLLARTVANNRPHLAHALWLLVLIKVLTPPVWSSPTSPFSWFGTVSNQPQTVVHEPEIIAEFNSQIPYQSHRPDPSEFAFSVATTDLEPVKSVSANPITDAVTTLPAAKETTGRKTGTPLDWPLIISWIWALGALTGIAVLVVRYSLFVAWMSRTREYESSEIAELAKRLSKKLGLRSGVRVRVLESPVGPVVLGLLRPTVVLPAAIVRGKSPDELAPLIAHELIHFRRGDLWWALVQAIAKNLFWFHPLVHMAERRVTREAERSCDEETIASLGCSPAAYARCLLGVLEQKHQLRVAPALPGVRPVDITSTRLERVMKLGKGIHQKSPAWVWLVLLLGCAITLPGSALIWAQEESGPLKTGTDNQAEQVEGESPVDVGKSPFVAFQLAIAEISEAETDELGIEWKVELPDFDDSSTQFPAQRPGTSTSIEREIPTRIAIIEPEMHLAVMDKAKANGNLIGAPSIVSPLAKTCSLIAGGEVPVAQSDGGVKFRAFGTRARLTPTQIDVEGIHFDCEIQFSRLGDERLPKQNPDDIDSFPWMSRTKIQASLTAKSGQTVAIRTQYENKNGETTPVVVLIQCRNLGLAKTNVQPNPAGSPLPSPSQQLVTLQTFFIRPEAEMLKGLGIKWTTCNMPAEKVPAKQAYYAGDELQFDGTGRGERKEATIVQLPTARNSTKYAVMDRAQRDQLLKQIKSQANSAMTQVPTISIADGTHGSLFDGVDRPFMVDAHVISNKPDEHGMSRKILQPVVKSFQDGVQIGFTPTLTDNSQLRLKSTFAFSKVVASTTIDAPGDKSAVPAKAQRPRIVKRDMSCEVEFPRDKFLVMLISDTEEKPVVVIVESVADGDRLHLKSKVTRLPQCFSFNESDTDGQQYQIMDKAFVHPGVKDISISTGQKTTFRFAFDIPEILIEDRQVVKVDCVSSKDIAFTGLKAGTTKCRVKTPDGSLVSFNVEVKDELLPGSNESPPSQVSLAAKIGMRCSVQLQHEVDKIDVVDKAQVEVEKLGDFQVLLKPRKPGNSKVLLTQKDGKTIELNLTISDQSKTTTQQPSLKRRDYHWLICCGDDDRSDLENFRTLKTCGLTLLLSKSVVLERNGKLTTFRGDNFFMITPEGVSRSGNHGLFEITTDIVTLAWTLKGNAKLVFPDSMIMEADEIHETPNPENRIELKGNARICQPEKAVSILARKFDAKADHIWFNDEGARLRGNASLTMKYQDGRSESFQGQEILYPEGEQPKVIDSPPTRFKPVTKTFEVAYIKPKEANRIIEEMFDERKRKSLRLSVDANDNQIIVTGTPKVVDIIESLLTRVDVVLEPNVKINVEGSSIKFEQIIENLED